MGILACWQRLETNHALKAGRVSLRIQDHPTVLQGETEPVAVVNADQFADLAGEDDSALTGDLDSDLGYTVMVRSGNFSLPSRLTPFVTFTEPNGKNSFEENPNMKPIQALHSEPEPDHAFAALHGVQRHLAPGQWVRLLAVDFFTDSLQEPVWVSVLSCGEHDYTGRVITPMRDFPQLAVGSHVTFALDHVAEVRGDTVNA